MAGHTESGVSIPKDGNELTIRLKWWFSGNYWLVASVPKPKQVES